jgi:hypothetical protein
MSNRLRTFMVCICLLCIPGAAAWVGANFSYTRQTPRTEIYRGVYYQCSQENGITIHLLEVDLSRPGIELFVTPVDQVALARGHEYRLDYVRNAARAEGLAVAVNGNVFSSDSYLLPMVGDFATSRDTIVADYKLNHLNSHDYLLWFDKDLRPHFETFRPAPLEVLQQSKWAIGGIDLSIYGDRPFKHGGPRDKRSIIGINHERMWIGVFESATQGEAIEMLMRAGARYVMTLDGGDSTSLYLGGRARGVPGGLRFGGQRPVATVIGIKADPILDPL